MNYLIKENLQEKKDGKDKFKMKNKSLESQEKKDGKVKMKMKNKWRMIQK